PVFVVFPFPRLVNLACARVWYVGRRYQIVRHKRPASPLGGRRIRRRPAEPR
ncbi:respiratory nitrate reductase subunit gamma, partial [Pseudomonas aeruginosa]|nr:respiratory nitrate reductase subunit gamma [Pseudomonas aeruginosa]